MKECILFCDVPENPRMKATQDTASGKVHWISYGRWKLKCLPLDTWYISPTLLHLIHPFALQNLITALRHVKKYYQFLKSLSARVETSQIAKDLLTDMIDYSGLNLEGLEGILESSLRNVETLRRECIPLFTGVGNWNSVVSSMKRKIIALLWLLVNPHRHFGLTYQWSSRKSLKPRTWSTKWHYSSNQETSLMMWSISTLEQEQFQSSKMKILWQRVWCRHKVLIWHVWDVGDRLLRCLLRRWRNLHRISGKFGRKCGLWNVYVGVRG